MNKKINKFPKFSQCNAFQILCLKYRMNRLINLLSDNTLKLSYNQLKKYTKKTKPIQPQKLTFLASGREEITIIKRNVIRNYDMQNFSRRSYQILKDKPVNQFSSLGSFVVPIQRSIQAYNSFSSFQKEESSTQSKRQLIQPYNKQPINKSISIRIIKQQQKFDKHWNQVLIRLFINTTLITTIIILIVSYLLL